MFDFEEIEEITKANMEHEGMAYLDALAVAIHIKISEWELDLGIEGWDEESIQSDIQAGYEQFLLELKRRGIQYDGRHSKLQEADDPFEVAESLMIDGPAIQGSIARDRRKHWYKITPSTSGNVKFEVIDLALGKSVMIHLTDSEGPTQLKFALNDPPKSKIVFSQYLTKGRIYFIEVYPNFIEQSLPITYTLVCSNE
ncbi:hypothetical protein [Tumebacillus algifaecis]|nr:hypothetical protein [Tumebacillus algifaecis]